MRMYAIDGETRTKMHEECPRQSSLKEYLVSSNSITNVYSCEAKLLVVDD